MRDLDFSFEETGSSSDEEAARKVLHLLPTRTRHIRAKEEFACPADWTYLEQHRCCMELCGDDAEQLLSASLHTPWRERNLHLPSLIVLLLYCARLLQRVRSRKQATAKPKPPSRRPAGLVNLRQLVQEGVLAAAEDVLTVEYKGTITHASLMADGRIKWKGEHPGERDAPRNSNCRDRT